MNNLNISKEQLKTRIVENVRNLSRKHIEDATQEEVYQAVAYAVRDYAYDKWIATEKTYKKDKVKAVYYLSMEFLMGRFLGNALINLTLNSDIEEVLKELNLDLNIIEDKELDPGLGNGGLGRLAACFLDSLATLELPAYGCGIRYHQGIFEQKIVDGFQVEVPDSWLRNGDSWGIRNNDDCIEVSFGGNVSVQFNNETGKYVYVYDGAQIVKAIPYDYPVIGYNNNTVNTLRLWDAEPLNEVDLKYFNAGDYTRASSEQIFAETLSEVLYPADEHIAGKELRLKQQYFFNSATVQTVLKNFVKTEKDLRKLPEQVVFQLNDTHPAITVSELMRVLIDIYGLEWDMAWDITTKTCAYTNHTIMAEALEKWPIELISKVLPRNHMIIEEINKRFCADLIDMYGNDPEKIRKMAIIADGQVRMAHLAMVGSFSVNGVAALHTEILKNQELKDFYEIFPKKFNNKTNGITQRRWLAHANKDLSKLITENIGDGWVKDLSELRKLDKLADDKAFQEKFMEVKHKNKVILAEIIKQDTGVIVDPNSIFDIQVKRLHEYKRQLLNVLHIIDLYNTIRTNPTLEIEPRTFIFGAKAAAGYKQAKLIIKLINSVAEVVNNDPVIKNKIKVVFLPNYRVSLAEKLITACDISEQISTASKEASGTGNMKFMLNGGLTMGTLDGANVEILEEVGEDNIFIFGLKADEVIEQYNAHSYNPMDVYNMNGDIRMVLAQLINGTFDADTEMFRDIYNTLLYGINGGRADEYFILADFAGYKEAQRRANDMYKNKSAWAKAAILNTAYAGKFSSDRTINEYANEIWNIKPTHITVN